MIKISIIVPVFNVERYLDQCIKSILKQSFKNFELILIDDGSTDKSGEICDLYKQKDERIKVIHKENGGLSSARNAGIEIAEGDYVAFIDSDDYIHKDMYSILYESIINNNSQISMCKFQKVKQNNLQKSEVNNELINLGSKNISNIEALNNLYEDNSAEFTVVWNKLYDKGLFDDLRFEEGKVHEDEFIAHKILFKCNQITYVPLTLYYYLQREGSIINSKYSIKNIDAVIAFHERAIFFKKLGLKDLQYKAEYNYVRYFFANYYKAKKYLTNIENELKSIKWNFSKSLYNLLKNPLFTYKEKLAWIVFIINCNTYKARFIKEEIN